MAAHFLHLTVSFNTDLYKVVRNTEGAATSLSLQFLEIKTGQRYLKKANSCVIEQVFNAECHLTVHGTKRGYQFLRNLDEKTSETIKAKVEVGNHCVASLCNHHIEELSKVSRLQYNSKCKGFAGRSHEKTTAKGIPLSTCVYYRHFQGNELGILPGTPICRNCQGSAKDLSHKSVKRQKVDVTDATYIPRDERFVKLNLILSAAGIANFQSNKLSTARQEIEIAKLVKAVVEQCISSLGNSGLSIKKNLVRLLSDTEEKTKASLKSVMDDLKTKYQNSDYKGKVQVLTIAPQNWTQEETIAFFSEPEKKCPISQIRRAILLRKSSGPLAQMGPKIGKGLPEDTVKAVRDFFYDDANSRQLAGMRDTIGVVENGIRVRRVKRLVLANLKELHILYLQANGETNPVSFSKFCMIRPKEMVLANARGIHNVCVCVYHGNVKLMLEAIGQSSEFRSKLINSLVCVNKEDPATRKRECMLGTCNSCKRPNQDRRKMFNQLVMGILDKKNITDYVKYSTWTQDENRGGLKTLIETPEEYIESLYNKFVTLIPLHFISSTQAAEFKRMRSESFLGSKTAVIQVDFGENYSFLVQDAPQSYHWETCQATIHPFAAWLSVDGQVRCISSSVISDERRHDTETFFGFLKTYLTWFLSAYPHITEIQYWSDGCAGQYKNCKNFDNIAHHVDDFGVNASWNFFATSHGKGAVDGISARLKDSARRHSMRAINEGHILEPDDLYQHCVNALPNIKFFFVTAEDIICISTSYKLDNRFSLARTYPQTRSCHRLLATSGSIMMYHTSLDIEPFYPDSSRRQPLLLHVSVDDWVAVRYLSTWYIARVRSTDDETGVLEVHFSDNPGNSPSYKFTGKLEHNVSWISFNNIIAKVSPAQGKTTRTRSHYYLSGDERATVEANL